MHPSALTLDEAVGAASTGDIWLFRGRSTAARAIQTLTNSPVNHVGMVVAIDDLPPLLWHAELGRSLPDGWSGEAPPRVDVGPPSGAPGSAARCRTSGAASATAACSCTCSPTRWRRGMSATASARGSARS